MSGTTVRAMVRSPFVLVVGVILTWFIAAFLVGCILLHRFAERPLYLFLCRLAERIVARRAAPPGPLGNA